MAKVHCPVDGLESSFIIMPDVWLGLHVRRRDEAVEKLGEASGTVLSNFAVAMSLIDDWNLPGINGNPDKWDFDKVDLRVIAWVNSMVLASFLRCFIVPKNSPPPLLDGSKVTGDDTRGN